MPYIIYQCKFFSKRSAQQQVVWACQKFLEDAFCQETPPSLNPSAHSPKSPLHHHPTHILLHPYPSPAPPGPVLDHSG